MDAPTRADLIEMIGQIADNLALIAVVNPGLLATIYEMTQKALADETARHLTHAPPSD